MLFFLRWSSLLCLSIGLFLLVGLSQAQDGGERREYEGADECAACHNDVTEIHEGTRHALTLQEIRRDIVPLAAFDQDEAIRTVTFPDSEETRPVVLEDVAYTLGSGKHVQRYLYRDADDTLWVMPLEWRTTDNQWHVFGETWINFVDECATCHTVGLDLEEREWVDDGVMCEACHGPARDHVDIAYDLPRNPEDEDYEDLRANVVLSPDAQVCGQCHSRGLSTDGTHPYPVGYTPWSSDLAASFGFVAPDDEAHWWASGHAKQQNMQYNEWMNSAHASALTTMQGSAAAAEACLVCHSSDYRRSERVQAVYAAGDAEGPAPEAVTFDTAQYGVTCIECHSPHAETEQPALLREDGYTLCTTCHANPQDIEALPMHHPVKEMFEGVALVEGLEGVPSVHSAAENGPDCLTCHMLAVPMEEGTRATHALNPILPADAEEGQSNACSACHETLTVGDLQSLVDDTQAAVRGRLATARARLASVDPTESPDRYQQVSMALDFVQGDGSLGVHNYAYTAALMDYAEYSLALLSVPGANLEPTEGPAPTAVTDVRWQTLTPEGRPEPVGARPITYIVLGSTGLILIAGAFVFLRKREQPHE